MGTLLGLLILNRVARPEERGATGPARAEATRGRGAPPGARTGLRLLVADAPAPFVLDVDRGTVQRIAGLPTNGDRGVTVVPLGEHALVLSTRFCNRCRSSSAYLVRDGSGVATPLGTALQVVPFLDGEGIWFLRSGVASRCTIGALALDGGPRQAVRQMSCRTGLVAELPAGLLVNFTGAFGSDAHGALLRPDKRAVRLADPQAQPVVGNLVLSGAGRRTPLVLQDVGSGARHRLRWPSRPGYSLGEVAGEPNGTRAIVGFAKYSPEHRLDLWLLDTTTRRWQHLPGMPAHLVPKATHVKWTADGRVVVLPGGVLILWRPGEPRLTVHSVRPPKQPGSEFVIL